MRSFTGGEARQMTEAPISLDAIFREGGECREIDVEYGTKISTDLHILHTGPLPLPSLFALLARHCYRWYYQWKGRVAPRG